MKINLKRKNRRQTQQNGHQIRSSKPHTKQKENRDKNYMKGTGGYESRKRRSNIWIINILNKTTNRIQMHSMKL